MADMYPANVTALPPGSSSLSPVVFLNGAFVFQVLPLKESAWIYIGLAESPMLENVSIMMMQSQTHLLGGSEEGARIAIHVQKRFRLAAVFVAYNGPSDKAGEAERALFEELVRREVFSAK